MARLLVPRLAALLLHQWTWAHPGTWDGEVIMNEDGAPFPDLTGLWADSTGKDGLVLQFYQPPNAPALPPNSSYSVTRGGQPGQLPPQGTCTLSAEYDYVSRNRTATHIRCEASANVELPSGAGLVQGDGAVHWGDSAIWTKQKHDFGRPLGRLSGVHKVHVIFMNHYDVGYTDFVNGVDNNYMHNYYPLAETTSQKMRANGSDAPFKYTTHPWLMKRFLTCPCAEAPCLATTLGNSFEDPLRCGTSDEIANFTASVERGDIAWNAAPFNVQPENMAPELFAASFSLAREMDKRFGRNSTKSMTIRDVMYVTRAVLPWLKKEGITGLTIGSNGSPVPPQVPKLHLWQDPATNTEIVVAYHPYGYGGYGLKDCAESPNGVALCTEFRTDNTGPPSSLKEVSDVLDAVRREYPGADVRPSTFDAFFADVEPVKDQLPRVNLEVADTWTYGVPSDPLKTAQHRAIQRAWVRCLQRGEPRCAPSDPVIANMTFFLVKGPEHTWGTPGISGWGGSDDYNATRFRANLTNDAYLRAAASWAEQRIFNELAVRTLEEAGHPLAQEVRSEVNLVEHVSAPDLEGYHPVDPSSIVQLENGVRLGFGQDGRITTLEHKGVHWASDTAALAGLVYRTLNDTEFDPFTYAYCNDHQKQTGFCKSGSNNFSESAVWRPLLGKLLVKDGSGGAVAVMLEMAMPEKAYTVYGAPRNVFLQILPSAEGIDLSLITLGKLPTMIGEALMLTFKPAPALEPPTAGGSGWRIQKLGQLIDPEGVLDGGNQFTHGAWPGVIAQTAAGTLAIESLDSAIVNPMTDRFPVGNPLPATTDVTAAHAGKGTSRLAPGSVNGMAATLHNNLWNTNYALFYPFFDPRYCSAPLNCRNSNSLYRFRLLFQEKEEIIV